MSLRARKPYADARDCYLFSKANIIQIPTIQPCNLAKTIRMMHRRPKSPRVAVVLCKRPALRLDRRRQFPSPKPSSITTPTFYHLRFPGHCLIGEDKTVASPLRGWHLPCQRQAEFDRRGFVSPPTKKIFTNNRSSALSLIADRRLDPYDVTNSHRWTNHPTVRARLSTCPRILSFMSRITMDTPGAYDSGFRFEYPNSSQRTRSSLTATRRCQTTLFTTICVFRRFLLREVQDHRQATAQAPTRINCGSICGWEHSDERVQCC